MITAIMHAPILGPRAVKIPVDCLAACAPVAHQVFGDGAELFRDIRVRKVSACRLFDGGERRGPPFIKFHVSERSGLAARLARLEESGFGFFCRVGGARGAATGGVVVIGCDRRLLGRLSLNGGFRLFIRYVESIIRYTICSIGPKSSIYPLMCLLGIRSKFPGHLHESEIFPDGTLVVSLDSLR